MNIRAETDLDAARIRDLTRAAFAGAAHASGNEATILDRLRVMRGLSLSLVMEHDEDIVAHVAFSPVLIDGRDLGWVGLGPVSVLPALQGRGLGTALIREGLTRIAAQGARGCVVLGDPQFYRRFGFTSDANLQFDGAPPEYFMRLAFGEDIPTGHVTYQPAFQE